jgi:hypothetical protein
MLCTCVCASVFLQLSMNTVPTNSRRIREQTLPQVFVDCKRQIACELDGDGPINMLIDGCTRRAGHMSVEAFLGRHCAENGDANNLATFSAQRRQSTERA